MPESAPDSSRHRVLQAAGLLHPQPQAVVDPLFDGHLPFSSPLDKAQVKYEMLRAHFVDRRSATWSAENHGYSRAAFYLVSSAFEQSGMLGLLDEPRGRRGPLKLTPELLDHLLHADRSRSGADLAQEIEQLYGVHLHRRTIERARRR